MRTSNPARIPVTVFRVAFVAAVVSWAATCAPVGGTDPPVDSGADGDADTDAEQECSIDSQCDDRIVCTVDHCAEGRCGHQPCTDCCEEGLECIVGFGCGHAPLPCTVDDECQDETRCTLDRCQDETFCQHLPQDGLCDDGEICLAALGCIPRPPETCEEDQDCQPDRPCLGHWYCDPEFGCQFLSVLDCDDDDPCTDDSCDDEVGGCVHGPRDQDEDGYGDDGCGGDDCDDLAPDRNPGAAEECNGLDDDCDGDTDEGCCDEDQPCDTECGSRGSRECLPDGSYGPCRPPGETCNGEDDDCDGDVDEACCDEGAPCETECGTTGARECLPDGSEGPCRPPDETCNGEDDDCDDDIDEGCCVAGEPCVTTCRSTGTRECRPDGSEGPCRPPGEVCNGADDDCDGLEDEGFDCSPPGRTQPCASSCRTTGTRRCSETCEWEECLPPDEECNGTDDDCDGLLDEDFGCVRGTREPCPTSCGSTGTRACLTDCSWDVCAPPAEVCNGVDDDCDRTCDDGFRCCARSERDCSTLGFYSGTALCADDCSGWVTSTCSNCGNGVIDAGESCDGADLGGNDCTTIGMGFGGGRLRCAAGCRFDTSGCTACGNGRIDPGEQCDGAALGGQTCITRGHSGGVLGCTGTCTFDETGCTDFDPSGIYTLAPAPRYSCAFGMVNFNVRSLTFSDDGVVLRVGGAPCAPGDVMTGPSARDTREFSVRCTYEGTCDETYILMGHYTSDDRWEGEFRASYAGSCFDCSAQIWAVVGTR
jgi:hypothetical protein